MKKDDCTFGELRAKVQEWFSGMVQQLYINIISMILNEIIYELSATTCNMSKVKKWFLQFRILWDFQPMTGNGVPCDRSRAALIKFIMKLGKGKFRKAKQCLICVWSCGQNRSTTEQAKQYLSVNVYLSTKYSFHCQSCWIMYSFSVKCN